MKGITFFVLVILGITNTFLSYSTSRIINSTQREEIDFLLKTKPKIVSEAEALRVMSDDSLFVNLRPKVEKISCGNFFYPKYYFRTSYLYCYVIQSKEWDGTWIWKTGISKIEFSLEVFDNHLFSSRLIYGLLIFIFTSISTFIFIKYNKDRLLKKRKRENFIKGI